MEVGKKCTQLGEKRKGFFYVTDECGCRAKVVMEYTINNKAVVKTLCLRHFNSNRKWLDKILIPFKSYDINN